MLTSLIIVGAVCLTLIILVTNISSHVASVKKHAAEQKAEVDRRANELAFPPEKPVPPSLEQQKFDAENRRLQQQFDAENKRLQQALDAKHNAKEQVFKTKQNAVNTILERRKTLEQQISSLRSAASNYQYSDKGYAQYRADSLAALKDARQEQAELVIEQANLLATIKYPGEEDEPQVDAPAEPVRVATGGPVAQRVDDPDLLHDAEPDQPEASREGVA